MFLFSRRNRAAVPKSEIEVLHLATGRNLHTLTAVAGTIFTGIDSMIVLVDHLKEIGLELPTIIVGETDLNLLVITGAIDLAHPGKGADITLRIIETSTICTPLTIIDVPTSPVGIATRRGIMLVIVGVGEMI